MGRRKKEQVLVPEESVQYVVALVKAYPKLHEFCSAFENERPGLIQFGGINLNAFKAEAYPSVDLFVEPAVPDRDYQKLAEYLDAKEKVYLLEHGVFNLEGRTREIAKALFLDEMSWYAIIYDFGVSRMTVDRERKKALSLLAKEVDSYMDWKAKMTVL